MTTTEMIYVLDKEKECIQKRSLGLCNKECKGCDSYIESTSLLDGLEKIINYIFHMDKRTTRKEY